MERFFRVLLYILLCATLFPVAAIAETCFVIDVDTLDMQSLSDNAYVHNHLSGQTQGVRVRKYISDSNELAARVRLTIMQAETSSIVYDKNYGFVGGTFDSGDIYLPYVDNNTIPYLITLTIEDWTFSIPFMQLRPMLSQNTACTYGLRLRDANPMLTDGWVMGTMLDIEKLRQTGGTMLPVCASNQYIVGYATVWVGNEQLTVSLTFLPEANATLDRCAVYLIDEVSALTTLDANGMTQRTYGLDQSIPITGIRSALLYVPMILSYDPSTLQEYTYNPNNSDVSAQWQLWQDNVDNASAVEEPTPAETPWSDSEAPLVMPEADIVGEEALPQQEMPEVLLPKIGQAEEPDLPAEP